MFVMGFLGQSANAGEIHVESMVEEPCDASAEHGFRVEVPEEPLLERPEVDMVPELHEESHRGIVEARLVLLPASSPQDERLSDDRVDHLARRGVRDDIVHLPAKGLEGAHAAVDVGPGRDLLRPPGAAVLPRGLVYRRHPAER